MEKNIIFKPYPHKMDYGKLNRAKRHKILVEHGYVKNIGFIDSKQGIIIKDKVQIAVKKNLFKPLGIIDWATYKINDLLQAIEIDNIDEYYKKMLIHDKSPDNIWKNKKLEKDMKDYYITRATEINLIKENL